MLFERERDALIDIIENAKAAEEFTTGMTFEAFAVDQKTAYAVVRCLEIISEASRRLSSETKARHPDLPWRIIADLGNVYRHSYHRVEPDMVWLTLKDRLGALVAACHSEVAPPPEV
ncbi:HepT-like ribonuclease domain-containing protein [Methylobacterium sp. Leaf466]|uniref:HepT-like ribonuclease domain-containing protein n=1 Tax=Methylobacterium sp. Leaf466 TaxID=1736386 RepID=UPI0006F7B4F0|nr:HepT-like ribonuclease domain-containing protein [Methylobacterium sp. Leaf466]KQT80613.1 hypothetical protein ASG59_04035 [Methylobacterium sp. Leaf466]